MEDNDYEKYLKTKNWFTNCVVEDAKREHSYVILRLEMVQDLEAKIFGK
jgi:hypothetical protein